MELTGDVLKEFWIWYLLPENQKKYKTYAMRKGDSAKKIRFVSMSFTERYGVYVDFFGSVGIHLDTAWIGISFEPIVSEQGYSQCDTRQEARVITIEKACEIYNAKFDETNK